MCASRVYALGTGATNIIGGRFTAPTASSYSAAAVDNAAVVYGKNGNFTGPAQSKAFTLSMWLYSDEVT